MSKKTRHNYAEYDTDVESMDDSISTEPEQSAPFDNAPSNEDETIPSTYDDVPAPQEKRSTPKPTPSKPCVKPKPKVTAQPTVQPTVPQAKDTTPTVIRKKRIRIRKKATKKLSVAILCADPSTRRFI